MISFLAKAGNPPSIIFKENKGQWPEKVLFGAEFLNTKFYINKTGFNYCFYDQNDLIKAHDIIHHRSEEGFTISPINGHNYEVSFENAVLKDPIKTNEQHEYYNYFLGNVKSKWASNVKAFGALVFNNIYSNIDLKISGSGTNIKYDLILKPGANLNEIKLNYKYVNGINLVNNELHIATSVGTIIEKAPYAYQLINGKQKQVKCYYALLENNSVGFVFPEGYNKTIELVIDPTVVVASYSGSLVDSDNSACTYDKAGNIYNLGYSSMGYPLVNGAFHVPSGIDKDFVLSSYNKTGTIKNFATYLGGDSTELPNDINVMNNEITLFGQTWSKNFPHTITAFDTTFNGKTDLVVSKLDMTGTILLGSTYIGGDLNDGLTGFNSSPLEISQIGEMVCDTSGNVYVLSATNSTNFPVSTAAFSPTRTGNIDACVFKLDKTLSNLAWSTYLGGGKDESGRSIRQDGIGGVYCYGVTTSTNFPVTTGCLQSTKGGIGTISDCYVTHVNSTGTGLIASTYLGTINQDYASLMDIDLNGDVYLTGGIAAPSTFTPSPPGIYNSLNGRNAIYKINGALSAIIYKTKYGNFTSGIDPYYFISAFKVDSCQNLYLAGYAQNSFQTTPDAFQPYAGGPTDFYFAGFSANCTSLKFASFWGGPKKSYNIGEHSDGGLSHFDDHGYLYKAVCTTGGLPTTAGSYAPTRVPPDTTTFNDFILKIDFQTFINAGSSYGANIIGCPPFTPTFVSTTNTGTSYWNLGNSVTSTQNTVSTTYTNLGTYNVLLVVTDTNTCNRYDSIKSILNVINPTAFDLGEDIPACFDSRTLLQANISAVTYSWSTGQTTPNIYVNQIGTYTLTINNGGCNSSDEINVVLGEKKLSERFPNVVTPNGDNINDYIDFIKYNFEEVEFYVFDRWGRERYKITKPDEKWNPSDLNNGTYYYVANYKSSCTGKFSTDKGFISIFK